MTDEEKQERHRVSNRKWKRKWTLTHRAQQATLAIYEKLLLEGRCPLCQMFLSTGWHQNQCRDHIHQIVYIEAEIALNKSTIPTITA